eukprot:TRINITY_DN33022_c0_g1_i1.p2 TRINITY_DN33022_c0_g1~~TRINITY_DN33022_c0_g1_i1.p2  ORF type:complete len:241 (+),score=121.67 TRINITY_DN33022_c0_g1_i1:54-776(+)
MPPKDTDEQSKALIKRIEDAKGDWFKALGLEVEETSEETLKKAYRQCALLIHPDKCKVEGCKQAFQDASKAYKALSDPDTLRKFQDAAKKKAEQEDYVKKYSSLERFLRESQEANGLSAQEKRMKMEAEMSPEERAKYQREKADREHLLRREREIRERQDRLKRKERQKEDDIVQEEQLQHNIGQWRNFQSGKGKRPLGSLPAMKQNIGAVRKSDVVGNTEPEMDYKRLRKSWQDHSRVG